MNNIIILLIIILILSYFVFLYDLNNFIQYKNIDKFSVKENKCYAKNMNTLDVNMRKCSLYYTNNTELCDNYPELYVLSRNYLLNKINNPNNNPDSIIINDKEYTLDILKKVYYDKSRNNITSTCKYNPEGLYEIDNKLNDVNKYQKKIILNSSRPTNNYMYSCFLPLDDNNITSNGLIDQYIIDTYNTENTETPCVDDKTPVTNIICHGSECPPSNKFLPINLNVVQRVNNNIIDIDDTLIFIKFRQTNYGIKSISFDSFVQYNKTTKIFQKVDDNYIQNIIKNKFFSFIYKNGKIYLTSLIFKSDVFTFTFNDNNNILLYDILNNPLKDFSFKYLNIVDIQLDNYNTTTQKFYNPVKRLASYIASMTNEAILDNSKINYYIDEYNKIKIKEKEESILRLDTEINDINNIIRETNERKFIELAKCPANKNICWKGDIYKKCNYLPNNSLSAFCINTVVIPCLNCDRNRLEKNYEIILYNHNNTLQSKITERDNIIKTPVDISNNINKLETYPGIFDMINISQFVFNNAYINNFDDSLLSVDDNCIYVNIPI